MHFRPFHSTGLWLAVTTIPAAPRSIAATPTVGVAAMPRRITAAPVRCSPSTAACSIHAPEGRGSRPSTIVGGPLPVVALTYDANAAAKRRATSAVIDSPTMPRAPETESMRGADDVGPMGR